VLLGSHNINNLNILITVVSFYIPTLSTIVYKYLSTKYEHVAKGCNLVISLFTNHKLQPSFSMPSFVLDSSVYQITPLLS